MGIRQTKHYQYPRIWLMTDPRIDAHLLKAIQRLPTGSGVVFRHYQLGEERRLKLFRHVARICHRRGHILLLAGNERQARRWHADGFHSRSGPLKASPNMLRSAPVHDVREMTEALRLGADLLFISPLFATASHPGERPLGPLAFARLAMLARSKAIIALGGVSKRKAATLNTRLVHGWAAIDAFQIK